MGIEFSVSHSLLRIIGGDLIGRTISSSMNVVFLTGIVQNEKLRSADCATERGRKRLCPFTKDFLWIDFKSVTDVLYNSFPINSEARSAAIIIPICGLTVKGATMDPSTT